VNGKGEIVWQHNAYAEGDEEHLLEIIRKIAKGEKVDYTKFGVPSLGGSCVKDMHEKLERPIDHEIKFEWSSPVSVESIDFSQWIKDNFSKEDYKLALLHFDEILNSYPDDANALFYGAMCLYNLQEYGQAEGRFLKLQNIPFANFREEGNWYLLHVYQQTKKEAAFSSLRNSIMEEKGFYAQKAENLRLH
jgi:tetratricopeptide (TPR) repeat protein